MPILQRFADLQPTPWAGGGGATTELVAFDDSERLGGPGARWRLSVADLEQPGTFSLLPGVQRTFVPVGGAVMISVDDEQRECTECRPFQFEGDARTELVALTGRCHAVNLMVDETSQWFPRLTRERSGDVIAAIALDDGDGWERFDLLTGDADIPSALFVVHGEGREGGGGAESHS
jgi:environmental stress-induced protein Ves